MPSRRPGRRAAASSVAPVASGYERALRPCIALTQNAAPTKRHSSSSSLSARSSAASRRGRRWCGACRARPFPGRARARPSRARPSSKGESAPAVRPFSCTLAVSESISRRWTGACGRGRGRGSPRSPACTRGCGGRRGRPRRRAGRRRRAGGSPCRRGGTSPRFRSARGPPRSGRGGGTRAAARRLSAMSLVPAVMACSFGPAQDGLALDQKNSPSRVRFRPAPRRTFRFRVAPTGEPSSYSRPVLGARGNLKGRVSPRKRSPNVSPQRARIFSESSRRTEAL